MSYPQDLDEVSEDRLVRELAARRISRNAGLCDYCNRPIGSEPTCKERDRHDGRVPEAFLLLSDVSRVNRARCGRWHPGYPGGDETWTGADWANALAGEVGEACNVVKKLRRIDIGQPGLLDPPADDLLAALAHEVADVFLYLDLLAGFYGVDVEAALRTKFDIVSERQAFPERLGGAMTPAGAHE